MKKTFGDRLEFGKDGETLVMKWIQQQGYSIVPVTDIQPQDGCSPCILTAQRNVLAPDLLIFGHNKIGFVEVKRKSAFTWHRITRRWVTGIDIRYYEHYIEARRLSSFPLWLLFLQEEGIAKDTPEGMICPSGLYGETITNLQELENHRWSDRMVYWAEDNLRKLATLEKVISCSTQAVDRTSQTMV